MSSSAPGVVSLGSFDPNQILAGDFQRVTDSVDIPMGNVLAAGTVLGKVTSTGHCVAVDSSKSDGSEKVYGVLAEDVDATDRVVRSVAFLTGEFAEQRLVFGGSDTADTHRAAARALSIFFKDTAIQPNE